MKYLFKKYCILLLIAAVINLPILVISCIRTDKTITLKGDTTLVEDFVEIENPFSQKGSFSTIYVISMDHSTILQNLMVGDDNTAEVEDMSEYYLHLSNNELSTMGSIQHSASINYAIIEAYKNAKKVDSTINIEYEFDCFKICYYGNKSEFRIGDQIIGVNGIFALNGFEEFKEAFNNATSEKDGNDTFAVLRNGIEISISNTVDNMFVSGYSFYNINIETVSPKFSIKPTNVGGPSGGLLQTLALYNALVEEDITKGYKIAGTGTISAGGAVGEIGGITQKIYTAYDDNIDIFLCPEANYAEAKIAYDKLPNKERMRLYCIRTFEEALEVLKNA